MTLIVWYCFLYSQVASAVCVCVCYDWFGGTKNQNGYLKGVKFETHGPFVILYIHDETSVESRSKLGEENISSSNVF